MEHEHSILYEPVNHLLKPLLGFAVPDHVLMALLVLVISLIIFPLASRRLSRDNPSRFQHVLELVVSGLKDLLDDVVGHGASKKYL